MFPMVKSQYWCASFSHIFIFSHFLVFRLCTLVHTLILHVLSFQNPIYRYPYYSLVYNVGFYLTEYKLVSPSSQSSSKLHRTCSRLIVVPSCSLKTIVKVLVLVAPRHLSSFFVISRQNFVVLRCFSSKHRHSSSHLVTIAYLCLVGVDLVGRVTLPSTLILPFIVLVFIGDSVICVLAGISTLE